MMTGTPSPEENSITVLGSQKEPPWNLRSRPHANMDNLDRQATPDFARAADWLPNLQPSLSKKALYPSRHIKQAKDHDWFLALAWAIDHDKQDEYQSKCFCKFYIFLCNCIPQGLAGDYAYISGNNVIEQLLSYGNNLAPSRHKIGLHTDAAFADLEK